MKQRPMWCIDSIKSLALLAGISALFACALPSVDESGKNRCLTDDDCLHGSCVGGFCGTGGDSSQGLSSCPEVPCAAPWSCYRGLCAETFETTPACDPYLFADGCPADAICFDDPDDVTRCRRFPACPTSGECPVGPYGAVCNDGDIPGKARMCVPGACDDAGNCPPGWSCIRFFDADALGVCGDGSAGMACRVNEDCINNNCDSFWRVCL